MEQWWRSDGTGVEQAPQPWNIGGTLVEHWWHFGGTGPAAVERHLRCQSCGTQSGSECCVLQELASHTRAMPIRLTQSGEQRQELLLGCRRRGSRAFNGDLGV